MAAAAQPSSTAPSTHIVRYFRLVDASPALLARARAELSPAPIALSLEYCFNVECTAALSARDRAALTWLLSETFEPEKFAAHSLLAASDAPHVQIVEVSLVLVFKSPSVN